MIHERHAVSGPIGSTTSEHVSLVERQPMTYLAHGGRGAPGGPVHRRAIAVLTAVADAVRRTGASQGMTVPTSPLEGVWWVEGDHPPFEVSREEWRWTLLVRVLDTVPQSLIDVACAEVPGGEAVELTTLDEGLCLEALHVGPYVNEPVTLGAMSESMRREGLVENGRHHEIYLAFDPQAPERARTVLRQPVRRR